MKDIAAWVAMMKNRGVLKAKTEDTQLFIFGLFAYPERMISYVIDRKGRSVPVIRLRFRNHKNNFPLINI